MQQFNSKYMQVKALYLIGEKEPVKDIVIYFTTHFIITFTGEEDTAPTWYNINAVERMEGVEPYKAPAQAPKQPQHPVWRI